MEYYLNSGISFLRNDKFTIISCIIISVYIARISNGYRLPLSLYNIFNNPVTKVIFIILILLLTKINLSLSIMIILSYSLFIISYETQNIQSESEKYTNYRRFISNK
jgi:hypothetical protein